MLGELKQIQKTTQYLIPLKSELGLEGKGS